CSSRESEARGALLELRPVVQRTRVTLAAAGPLEAEPADDPVVAWLVVAVNRYRQVRDPGPVLVAHLAGMAASVEPVFVVQLHMVKEDVAAVAGSPGRHVVKFELGHLLGLALLQLHGELDTVVVDLRDERARPERRRGGAGKRERHGDRDGEEEAI